MLGWGSQSEERQRWGVRRFKRNMPSFCRPTDDTNKMQCVAHTPRCYRPSAYGERMVAACVVCRFADETRISLRGRAYERVKCGGGEMGRRDGEKVVFCRRRDAAPFEIWIRVAVVRRKEKSIWWATLTLHVSTRRASDAWRSTERVNARLEGVDVPGKYPHRQVKPFDFFKTFKPNSSSSWFRACLKGTSYTVTFKSYQNRCKDRQGWFLSENKVTMSAT